MKWDEIIDLVLDDAKGNLGSQETVLAGENVTLWDDIGVHATTGLPTVLEGIVLDHVDAVLAASLNKLPAVVQEGLWWETEAGWDLAYEVKWAWNNAPQTLPELERTIVTDKQANLVSFLFSKLLSLAEADLTKKESGTYE